MKIKDFFEEYLKIKSSKDEDGVYRYLLEDKDGEIVAEGTDVNEWDKIDLSNKLIIDCDDDNYIAMTYRVNNRQILSIAGTKISGGEILDEEYEDADGNMNKEKAIILYSNSWTKRYLRIDLYPHLSVSLDIDYDKYDTDENGVIIWE